MIDLEDSLLCFLVEGQVNEAKDGFRCAPPTFLRQSVQTDSAVLRWSKISDSTSTTLAVAT